MLEGRDVEDFDEGIVDWGVGDWGLLKFLVYQFLCGFKMKAIFF